MVKMKALARQYMWWPKIDAAIEQQARACQACQATGKLPPRVTPRPWNWPSKPFQRIHVDFARTFMGHMFLLIIDAYLKWLEVERTIDVFRDVFARFGIPEMLVSNNGPQFVSEEMARLLLSMGEEHMHSAPYYPQSNEEAERSI
ncbi:uncharacterized protein K02A2.6-like [Corticium candelabrum]|uniref:uncharacterized protein K02A2.6-like n=1 Tax=Corticium candelabrum TaxID=121492 RepID=UPI002E25F087|nr:uncharacterized protein K02A2.6-like [Corticium candelabrum]